MKTHLRCGLAILILGAAAAAAQSPPRIIGARAEATFAPGETVTLSETQRAKILRAIIGDHSGRAPQDRVINETGKPTSSAQSLPAPTGELRGWHSSPRGAAIDAVAGFGWRGSTGGQAFQLFFERKSIISHRSSHEHGAGRNRPLAGAGCILTSREA